MDAILSAEDLDRAVSEFRYSPSPIPQVLTSTPGAPVADLLGRGVGRLSRQEHLDRAHAVVEAKRVSAAHLANRWKGKTLIIVGSGPSLKNSYHDLHQRINDCRKDVCVLALNKSHDALIAGERKGRNTWHRYPIVPEFAMMVDPKPWCATYMTPHPKPLYLFGTGIDQAVWQKFDAYNLKNPKAPARMFWFYPLYDREGEIEPGKSDADEFIQKNNLNTVAMIAGGSNVGLRALNIAMLLGFDEKVELWAYDSCYAPGGYIDKYGYHGSELYAFDKPNVEHNARGFDIEARSDKSRLFCIANEAMQRQVVQFAGIVKEIEDLKAGPPGTNPMIDRMNVWKAWVNGVAQNTGFSRRRMKIMVGGDGAIPWMAWKDGGPDRVLEHIYPDRMKAKYGESKYWNYADGSEIKGKPTMTEKVT